MSVKLRLRRMGRKKLPVFAVVVADSRSPRDGRFIEDLGRYMPLREPSSVELKEDRVLYWLSQGAQPSDTVRNLLNREGVLLAHTMRLKGSSEDEIKEAVAKHRAYRYEKLGADVKETPASRRSRALEEERERVAKEEEEAAKARAEADAKAKKEAEEAKKKAAEERAAAAAEARKAQESANVAQEEAETDEAVATEPKKADDSAAANEEADVKSAGEAEVAEAQEEPVAKSSESEQNADVEEVQPEPADEAAGTESKVAGEVETEEIAPPDAAAEPEDAERTGDVEAEEKKDKGGE